MTTLLLKVCPNIKAVSNQALGTPLLPTFPVNKDNLVILVGKNMPGLLQSYVTSMPDIHHSKDIEFLTLVNLVDNYIPLVLSIYSIVFKCNDYDLYCKSLLRCWVMLMVLHRRHYHKTFLVILSTFMYWEKNNHPMYNALRQALAAFDEYPFENFHSA